jgi:hypothetical protein|tara:strand:+ start:544 stop:747 length:204 start_codon:yes stop_codon:yes gene_type:complete
MKARGQMSGRKGRAHHRALEKNQTKSGVWKMQSKTPLARPATKIMTGHIIHLPGSWRKIDHLNMNIK